MDDIRGLCRAHTGISGRQAELLKNIGEGLPFIADLAQAQASLYAPTRDGSQFLVLAQARSHTMVQPLRLAPVGAFVAASSEPLVEKTLLTGQPLVGLRSGTDSPDSLEMHTYGIHDGPDAIAVVSLEVPTGQLQERGNACLVDTARMILQNSRSALDLKAYRALSPRDGVLIADAYGQFLPGFCREAERRRGLCDRVQGRASRHERRHEGKGYGRDALGKRKRRAVPVPDGDGEGRKGTRPRRAGERDFGVMAFS